MACIHGAIYQKRGLLTVEGKTIKNKYETLDLLSTLQIGHYPRPPEVKYTCYPRTRLVTLKNREAAIETSPVLTLALPSPRATVLPENPAYISEDLRMISWLTKDWEPHRSDSWWKTDSECLNFPSKVTEELICHIHHSIYLWTRINWIFGQKILPKDI